MTPEPSWLSDCQYVSSLLALWSHHKKVWSVQSVTMVTVNNVNVVLVILCLHQKQFVSLFFCFSAHQYTDLRGSDLLPPPPPTNCRHTASSGKMGLTCAVMWCRQYNVCVGGGGCLFQHSVMKICFWWSQVHKDWVFFDLGGKVFTCLLERF